MMTAADIVGDQVFIYGTSPRSGFITKDSVAKKLTRCGFPSDGSTQQREDHGCGKCFPGQMDPPGSTPDWCDVTVPIDFVHDPNWVRPWCGWRGCATKPEYFPQMQ